MKMLLYPFALLAEILLLFIVILLMYPFPSCAEAICDLVQNRLPDTKWYFSTK